MGDPRKDNLGYWMSEAAAKAPDDVAIIDLFGGQERIVTYGELEARLDRVAGALRAAGLKAGDRVILSCGNRTEFVEAMFGAMRAGVVPVPVNTRQGAGVLDYIAENCGAVGAIAEPAANAHIPEIANARNLKLRWAIDGDSSTAGWDDFATVTPPCQPSRRPCPTTHCASCPTRRARPDGRRACR